MAADLPLLLTDARIVTLPVTIYNSIRSILTPDLAAVSAVSIAIALAAIWLLDRLVGLDIFLRSRRGRRRAGWAGPGRHRAHQAAGEIRPGRPGGRLARIRRHAAFDAFVYSMTLTLEDAQ